MTYFFSASSKGFYKSGVNSVIPNDAIQITDDQYDDILVGLENGKVIGVDGGNKPILKDFIPLLTWDIIRNQRDRMLSDSDWTQMPDVNLSAEAKSEWITYRQTLRDITTTFSTPDSVLWPTPPA